MKNFRLDDESGHQEALFSWAGYNMGRMPELEYMHHVPNGGKRDRATAVALKRQGVKAGVPDIVLPAARAGYHGLYIELKAGKNTTTENQRRWLEYLRQQGYYTAVCYGWQKAAELIETYLLRTEELGEAGKIVEIMQQDNLEHIRLNEPERIQKRQDAADSLRVAVITAYEKGAVENG